MKVLESDVSRWKVNKPLEENSSGDRHRRETVTLTKKLADALRGMIDQTHICGEDCDRNATCPLGDAARMALAEYDASAPAGEHAH